MKKKILLGVITLFALSVFTLRVNAVQTSVLNIPFEGAGEKATTKAPTSIPSERTEMAAVLTERFDFSRVKFSTDTDAVVKGNPLLQKIILTEKDNIKAGNISKVLTGMLTGATNTEEFKAAVNYNNFLGDWFTGYCLDEQNKYPEYGLFSNLKFLPYVVRFASNNADEEAASYLFMYMLMAGFVNNKTYYDKYLKGKEPLQELGISGIAFKGRNSGDANEAAVYDVLGQTDPNYQNQPFNAAQLLGLALKGSEDLYYHSTNKYGIVPPGLTDEQRAGLISQITAAGYTQVQGPVTLVVDLNGLMLFGDSDYTAITESITIDQEYLMDNTLFDKYYVTGINSVSANYEDSLWILEHSYPTLTLQQTLDLAGVNLDTLKTQIIKLQKETTDISAYMTAGLIGQSQRDDLGGADSSPEELEAFIEAYVYSTIQYAVWYVNGSYKGPNGEKLGDTIVNEDLSELNKLYQFYAHQKGQHAGYGAADVISNKIEVETNDKYTETDNGYRFGPYKVSYTAVNGGTNITVALKDAIDGVKIVDKDGKDVSEVEVGGEYYIEIGKKAKVGSVAVNLTAKANTFEPASDRARVYSPIYGLYQNIITGGNMKEVTLVGEHTLTVNAKTGVENVAVLLMVTLVAFSLGYLVLSYRTKPVGLN